jgi:hypothetical protein
MHRMRSAGPWEAPAVRLPLLIDSGLFAEAEVSALCLDGDCFALGNAACPVDSPPDAAARAAAIADEAVRYGLVAALRTAAWVHGVLARPPRPSVLWVDLSTGSRTRAPAVAPSEVRLARGDVQRIGALRVTTPLRTAADLARLEPDFPADLGDAVLALLEQASRSPAWLAAALAAGPAVPHKRRAVDRLRRLAVSSR